MEEEERQAEHLALAALLRVNGIGSAAAGKLRAVFGSARAALHAPADALAQHGLPPKLVRDVQKAQKGAEAYEAQILETCERGSIRMTALGDDDYPPVLAEIFSPPALLYYRGTLIPDAQCLAMVGSRRFSRYGEGVAKSFAETFARAGFTVVSGAARGIDSAAHRGALRTGCTVAVLGCGVDIAYPAENRRLLADIVASGGAILSEYAPGTPPLPAFFPARNRIISGLSKGVIVVEAAERSGSLITAQLALDEGRDVFAVPGSIYSPTSQGCHRLIQQGAKLVTSVRDVLEEYGREPMPRAPRKRKDADLSGEERALYQVLSYEHPLSIDEIIASLKDGDPARLSFLLLGLELKGLVIENESHGYLRAERE